MKDIEFTVSDIKDLIEAFNKNKLGSMKIEQGSFKLKLKARGSDGTVYTVTEAPRMAVRAAAEPEIEEDASGNIIKSPIVGTFYAASAPDKEPFVKEGSEVKKGDVLFIIESMKLMNEVTSELDGTVEKILVQNGAMVEYGQPIISIRPA